jgi:hypothetical protein
VFSTDWYRFYGGHRLRRSYFSSTDFTDFMEMLRNHFQRAAIIASAVTKNPMNPKNP